MSKEQNKALLSSIIKEVFSKGKMSLIDELFASGFVDHEELPPGIPPGREGPSIRNPSLRIANPGRSDILTLRHFHRVLCRGTDHL